MATPAAGEAEHLALDLGAVVAHESERQLALARHLEIGGAILVAIGVAADDDRLGPAGHEPRHVLADDRLAEDDAAQNVADGAVGRAIHFLEAELLHSPFVGGDGGALDADADLLDRFCCFDRDPIARFVALLHAEVVIKQFDIEIGMDQLFLDEMPNDAGHLVAVHFDDRIRDFDLRHWGPLRAPSGRRGASGGRGRRRALLTAPRPAGVAIALARQG